MNSNAYNVCNRKDMNVLGTTYNSLIKLSAGIDTLLTHFELHGSMSVHERPVFHKLIDFYDVDVESICTPRGIGAHLRRKQVDSSTPGGLVVSDTYLKFIHEYSESLRGSLSTYDLIQKLCLK